jgi:hypothetical protein
VKPPILLVDGYDLVVFGTAEAAEGWMEVSDVEVGFVYDSEGRVLERTAEGRSVTLVSTEAIRADELRQAILRTFDRTGITAASNVSLDYLVAEASRNLTL